MRANAAAGEAASEAKASDPPRATLAGRLLSLEAAAMLGRNTLVSCSTFLLGLALLWLFVEILGMAEVPAVALSFLCATAVHYVFGRVWIFRGTERGVAAGYAYFLLNAGLGIFVTTSLFAILIELTSIHYLVVRVLVSLAAGLGMFLLNATLNFRRL